MTVNTSCFDIINGKVARLSRIVANGTPDYANAVGSVLLGCNVQVQLDPQIKTGTTKEKEGSCVDKVVNSYVGPNQRTGLKAKVTFAEISLPILDILGQAAVSTAGAAFYPSTNCSVATARDLILEVWFDLIHCDLPVLTGGVVTYGRLILPWCYGWMPSSGINIGPDWAVHEYDVNVKPNANFGVGPAKDVTIADAAGWDQYIYFDTTIPSPSGCNYVALPAAPS